MIKINEFVLKQWGSFKNILISHNYIVKILTINSKRAEHLNGKRGHSICETRKINLLKKKMNSHI